MRSYLIVSWLFLAPGPASQTQTAFSGDAALPAFRPGGRIDSAGAVRADSRTFAVIPDTVSAGAPDPASFSTAHAAGPGNEGGIPSLAQSHGVELSASYMADVLDNVRGGIREGAAYMHNVHLTLSLESEALFGWPGMTAYVHLISNNGGSLSQYVGDTQMSSSIEARNVSRVLEGWIQQTMLHGSLSFLLGVYDLNSEFYSNPSALMFLNASFGIGKELSQAGTNGPSIFPNTALAVRTRYRFATGLYMQTAVVDGVPGSDTDPSALSFHWDPDEGVLWVSEIGYLRSEEASSVPDVKVALGAWRFTTPADRVLSDPSAAADRGNNWGCYLISEKEIHHRKSADDFALSAFLRAGYANPDVNCYDLDIAFGVESAGLIRGRQDDLLGVGTTYARVGAPFREWSWLRGMGMRDGEFVVEISYLAQVTDWLAIQPDFQFVVVPSGRADIRNASVCGIRLSATPPLAAL